MKKLNLAALSIALASGPAWAAKGQAKIKGTAEGSAISGTAEFSDTKDGLDILVKLEGLAPGDHALHIHEFGACDDQGKAAGGHYNPKGAPHGQVLKDGIKKAHAGDFGNITVGADGRAAAEIHLKKVKLTGDALSVAGRAIVVHEKKDDFGQPTGNAGGRLACGTIIITAQ